MPDGVKNMSGWSRWRNSMRQLQDIQLPEHISSHDT